MSHSTSVQKESEMESALLGETTQEQQGTNNMSYHSGDGTIRYPLDNALRTPGNQDQVQVCDTGWLLGHQNTAGEKGKKKKQQTNQNTACT